MFKFAEMMKDALVLKGKMSKLEKALKKMKIEGESGGGMVKVLMDGQQKVLKISIDDELMKRGDRKFLEDLLLSAINDAREKSQEAAQEEMKKILGDLSQGLGDVGSFFPS